MKNFIKKNLVILVVAFAFLFSFTSTFAQSGQVSGSVCVEWVKDAQGNNTNQCARYVTGSVGTTQTGAQGGTPTCQPGYTLVNVNGQPMCQPTNAGGVNGSAVPTSAYVQGQNQRQIGSQQVDLGFFTSLIMQLKNIVSWLPQLLLGIAVVVFFIYLIKYIISANSSSEKKSTSLKGMMYSLVAIFVMVCLWGIIAFFGDAIGINPNVGVKAPSVPQ